MTFSDFTLRSALRDFGLTEERDTDLFADVPPLEPSPFLRVWLDEFAPVAIGVGSEFARNAYIIAPFLAEAKRRAAGPANVLPGLTLDVDKARGLSGFCDYVITRTPELYFLRGPLAAVVEAKREDVIGGLGQCAASMVAIREFNDKDGTPVPAVYGAVTSGTVWPFLRLADAVLSIDRQEYHFRNPAPIVGILVHIAGGPRPG